MWGTRFLGTAYNFGMELIFLMFLLSQSGGGDLKQSLRTFLDFYRENRELLSVLREAFRGDFSATFGKNPDEKPDSPCIQPSPQNEKNRPQDGIGDVLENYLKRAAL